MTLTGVGGLPEIAPGDDLAALIAHAASLQPGDVVVVCQKVVSKAEARLVPDRDPTAVIRSESRRMVKERGALLIAETRHGFVCANAGVDRSNVPPGMLCLLPEDPDASARRLAERLGAPVVITDTWGRPFRLGAVNVAIGVARLAPLADCRGERDSFGRPLESTTIAVADEIAAAAGLLMGKRRRTPVVVVRDCPLPDAPPGVGRDLLRDRAEDLFR